MKKAKALNVVVMGLVSAVGLALSGGACSQQGPKDSASGGSGGGSAGGGAPGAAGANQSAAGSNGSGVAGSTDSTGTAGSDSSGAAGASSTGAADSTGAAGSGTTNTLPATFAYPFDTTVQGWALNTYADTNRKNLADPASGSSPSLTWDSTTGDPSAGSLKATATFNDWKQYVDAIINVSPAKNIPGRVLRARVKLVSGKFTGGAQIHAGTGSSYKYAASAWRTLTAGQWTELDLDLDAAHAADSGFDPTMVVQVGVKFDTGGDGGTSAFGSAVDAVFQIDTVSDGVVDGALPSEVDYTFAADKQGFGLNDYKNPSRTNLAAAGSTAVPVLSWDGTSGDPDNGSLKLTATFSGFAQYTDVALNLSSVDLTGKTLHVFVKLDSGSFTGAAMLHVGTGPNYDFAGTDWNILNIGDWTELMLDLSAANAPGDVRQLGVQFDTGDAPDDASSFGAAVPAVFHIDSFTVTP
jgi:hypothetical protein